MNNAEEIQQEIQDIENELLRFKTVQGAVKRADGFYYTYTNSGAALQNQILRVKFANGEGPILCYCTSHYGIPLKITNNYQDFSFLFLWTGSVSFFSNRPIDSVENIT